jgi:hypothetical protein
MSRSEQWNSTVVIVMTKFHHPDRDDRHGTMIFASTTIEHHPDQSIAQTIGVVTMEALDAPQPLGYRRHRLHVP